MAALNRSSNSLTILSLSFQGQRPFCLTLIYKTIIMSLSDGVDIQSFTKLKPNSSFNNVH